MSKKVCGTRASGLENAMSLETYLHGTCGLFCNPSRNLKIVLTREEIEKLFSYCMEELRLLIEHPHEHDSLLERLATTKNSIELLSKQTFIKER